MATATVMARRTRTNRTAGAIARQLAGIDRRNAIRFALVLIITSVVALAAARFALASIVLNSNPALAERITGDPAASLRAMLMRDAADPALLEHHGIVAVAQRSLRNSPLDPAALRALAVHAAAAGRLGDTTRFAALSERVSRRDFQTQLILIEQAVHAEDYVTALRHYDIALRTHEQARDILFPVLSEAIEDPQIRQGIAPYVAHHANWIREFLDFAMRDGPAGPRRTAELVLTTKATRNTDLMVAIAPTLLGMLTDQREFALARALYAQLPYASPQVLRMPGFNVRTTDSKSGPFAWYAVSDVNAGASFDVGGSNNNRPPRIFAESGEHGVVLRRLLTLAPGRYRLDERRQMVSGGKDARAVWTMTCPSNASTPVLWTGPSDRAVYNVKGAPGPVIPSDCPVQRLELQASGGTDPNGLELVIDYFDLRP